MSDSIINDGAMRAARFALDGLALQQQMIGHNMANIDTPGYQAQTVDFQTALKKALNRSENGIPSPEGGDPLQALKADSIRTMFRSGGSRRADGNNVDIDVELAQMVETGISFQAITQLISKKMILLKDIADRR